MIVPNWLVEYTILSIHFFFTKKKKEYTIFKYTMAESNKYNKMR
jgi:hypothetical protein